MHVQTIQMDPSIARVHFLRYRKACKEHREQRKQELAKRGAAAGAELGRVRIAKTQIEQEDEQLLELYRHLCRGERLINLSQVMREAGVDDDHLPKLAIARADAKFCRFKADNWSNAIFYDPNRARSHNHNCRHTIRFPRDTFPGETWNTKWRQDNGFCLYPVRAVVPAIPPHLRPNNPGEYHILWEAVWEKQPPVDPILLKHVSGDHYVVVAQWDLTPVEQSVLAGRFN